MRCQFIRRLLAGVAFGLVGLLGTAQADVIDFEDLPPDSLFADGATFNQAAFYEFTQNGMFGASAVADSFAIAMPPTGNATQFYAALNDSALSMRRTDDLYFNLTGFDMAFLSPFPQFPGVSAGFLIINAIHSSGQALFGQFSFGLSADDGTFAFQSLAGLAGFSDLTSVTFSACTFDDAGNCTNPGFNSAQFALDNVVVAVRVPEPSTWAVLLLGLLLVGYHSRTARRT